MKKHNRKSTRLKGFDYSSEAAYFITIVTKNRKEYLGTISGGQMILSDLGKIVEKEWLRTEEIRTNVTLGKWVIMPNHLHSIITIGSPMIPVGNQARPKTVLSTEATFTSPSGTIGSIVRGFKAACTTTIRIAGNTDFGWHRNYHDHVIRDKQALNNIEHYIVNNPINWKGDVFDWEAKEEEKYFL